VPVHRVTLIGWVTDGRCFHGPFTITASIILAGISGAKAATGGQHVRSICIAASTEALSAFAAFRISAGKGIPFRELVEELLVQRRSRLVIRPGARASRPGHRAHAQPALCATVA
jgi:hypothetical protein